MRAVLEMHRDASRKIGPLAPAPIVRAAQAMWDRVVDRSALYGVRNSQISVLAPTGTISFMLDCDTTGIEPDLSLVKWKQLVGGGTLQIVNGTVGRALSTLGYSDMEASDIVTHIEDTGSAVDAPGLLGEHLDVFRTAMGDNRISPEGHLRMMSAVQPFLSGAISKTVNLDADVTVEDVEELFLLGWRLGLKAVAVYRDGSKSDQPMTTTDTSSETTDSPPQLAERRELPRSRQSWTTHGG